jgi:hypothetical protein
MGTASDMSATANMTFKTLVDDVARMLVATEHRPGGSFIRTPLLYPSGATVVVRIEDGFGKFFVSDVGLGHQEAEMMGAGSMYAKNARVIAEAAGVRFDNQAFFVLEASREQLPGAVITIANCSQEATIRASDALAEKTFEDNKLRLYERLVTLFERNTVAKNVDVIGSSTQVWKVAAIVSLPHNRQTIFEPVTKHPNSVAHASMKFGDIALRQDNPPQRVAVVRKRAEFGSLLTVLSRSANIIEDDYSNERIIQLAKAA